MFYVALYSLPIWPNIDTLCTVAEREKCSVVRLDHWVQKSGSYSLVLRKLCTFRICNIFHGATPPGEPGPPHYRAITISLRLTTVGRTPLDEWSARRRNRNLKGEVPMPQSGFEPQC